MKQKSIEISLHLLTTLAFLLAIVIFIKNAWVTEDAYIIFRSLEQFFAGNGPRWNPHDRVQVFTSPLWFWLLAAVRGVSSDVYLNALGVAFTLFMATLFVIFKIFRNPAILLLAVLLLIASNGFFDYTSSGLENPLVYFLISLYVLYYLRLFGTAATTEILDTTLDRDKLRHLFWVFGLILLVRHDLVILMLPSLVYTALKERSLLLGKEALVTIFTTLLPFILWSLFALIYYGTPLPNSAYAKLNTNIDKIRIFEQGAKYFVSSFIYDSITLPLIASSLVLTFTNAKDRHLSYLGLGIVLNLLYVGYIGGDFMQGRFFSYSYLLGMLLLLLGYQKSKHSYVKPVLWLGLSAYLLLYQHTPFNAKSDHTGKYWLGRISDERGTYFANVSLNRYMRSWGEEEIFPYHDWCREGAAFKNSSDLVKTQTNIGFYGYCAGTEKIIVDQLALSDPLLARLPSSDFLFAGHFKRTIPEGYLNSIINGQETLADPQLNKFYHKLKLITQNETLFSWARCKAIILMNLGVYDRYLKHL
jgi:arabinofuranosyltransferase